ncbi:metal-dependent hydrolase [Erwinia sp. OLTSP20]|uniref:metal-dependent hydrolase n=1 Tax=unclassified Erwinia TaxID=2622719 RepID=UPI000C1864C5|nr:MULTISPECIES: metal-dependent hydrolase [unclassified Erwinia]PIJ51857.1 metal-dependent hydrolase [Erwinia sp. OAMSP11]PIJ74445.1 metal-dependent hydrolase [Erwinia sp. OLSSP12]PIJ83722.1 metal-dependent hydrolase [Erwinia sp. OLCASP19]PIJ86765.1 metal-dependent hydrolase [Erwinia sp. OLMTSP26]PIJ88172.1 metal-dependent hydrolase [Erwinia sp. OLMDSP33]
MTAEGHLVVALASVIFAKRAALTPVLAQGDWWHLLPAALLSGLLPDIDHPHSFLGQRLWWISRPVARLFGHRGFTHSLLAVAGAIVLLWLQPPCSQVPADVLQGMVIGYLSHLAADMLTPAGVPLLWPCRWRFCLPLLNSRHGNQRERGLGIALVICALWFPVNASPAAAARHWSAQLIAIGQRGYQRPGQGWECGEGRK